MQAATDLKAKALIPVHWSKFRLGMHPWNEPVKRVLAKAQELRMAVYTPLIGEPLVLNGKFAPFDWWEL